MPIADFWLSKYELPAMLFYTYLRNNNIHKSHCPLSVKDIIERSIHKSTKQKHPEEIRANVTPGHESDLLDR